MYNFLFECVEGENEGEEILIGANSIDEAERIAESELDGYWEYTGYELSEFEAEESGLDEL